jgi:hypothetical protein
MTFHKAGIPALGLHSVTQETLPLINSMCGSPSRGATTTTRATSCPRVAHVLGREVAVGSAPLEQSKVHLDVNVHCHGLLAVSHRGLPHPLPHTLDGLGIQPVP